MPQAQWVLDASYAPDGNQASGPSPPRQTRGVASGLQLDLRGVSAGGGASRGLPSPGAAQWKPASSFKGLGVGDGVGQQSHPALLLSVLSSTTAVHSPTAGAPTPNSASGHPMSPTALALRGALATNPPGPGSTYPATATHSYGRGPASDLSGAGRGMRHQTAPPNRTGTPAFASARVTTSTSSAATAAAAAIVAAAVASGPAVGGSASPAAAAHLPRPHTYNPLLPRQDSSSVGRRRPATTDPPRPYDPYGVYAASAASARSGASGYTPTAALTGGPGGRRSSSVSGEVTGSPSGQGPGVGSHHLPGPQSRGGAHASPASLHAADPREQGYVPLAVRNGRSRFEAVGARGNVAGGGGAGERSGAGSRHPSYETDPRQQQQQPQQKQYSPHCQTFHQQQQQQQASGGEGPSGGQGFGAYAQGPAGAGRWQRPAQLQSTRQQTHGSGALAASGLARGDSVTPSSSSSAEDSAFEYLGVYEGDALSGEDGEEGALDDGESDGGEAGEEGCGSFAQEDGSSSSSTSGDDRGIRRRHPSQSCGRAGGSSRGVRSTASVHAVRKAEAAAGAAAPRRPAAGVVAGAAAPPPSSTPAALAALAAAVAQHPWAVGHRPPSATSGRPPVAPWLQAAPLAQGRGSNDAGAGAASGASLGSHDGSASSESGSRPATASSNYSIYDGVQYVGPELRAQGQGRAANGQLGSGPQGLASEGGGGGGTTQGGAGGVTALERRRAASNPRDAAALKSQRGGRGGGGISAAAAAAGEAGDTGRKSRCSSAASSRRGGGHGGAAAQALALVANVALVPPSSPGGASTTSRSSSARRRAPPLTSRHRKAGGAVQHRPLHPAVLSLAADLALASPTLDRATPRPPTDEIPTDAKGRAFPYVLAPVVPGTCPTIAFIGTAAEKHAAGMTPLLSPTLFVKYGGVANTPVRVAFREAGLRPTRKGKRWIVQWGGILDPAGLAKLHSFQRVNHFPGTWELGHKGHLYRNVYAARRRARGPAAEAFDIVPRFYIMPRDYEEFRSDCERYPDRLYIQKPTNSSRGRGIRMVTRPEAIARDAKDLLVQHYVANPLLLNGFKFDMRVYAAATCMDPLRLYVFPDGLARLATEPYSSDRADLSKRCVHLTNYSVNKKSNKFVKQADPQSGNGHGDGDTAAAAGAAGAAVGGSGGAAAPHPPYSSRPVDPLRECEGSKWSLSGLRAFLEHRGIGPGWEVVWRQVCDIVAAAVIAAEPRINTDFKMKVPHRNNCFEVWGFDIMLTDTFRAWLIEANTCPSLAADSGLDMRVKCSMVAELMHMLGPVPYDVQVYEKEAEAKRQARLTGLPAAAPAGRGGGGGPDDDAGAAGGGGAQQASGGGPAGGASSVVQPKSLHELEFVDFTVLSPGELPDIVLEAEAEMARRGSWKRVFPCEDDPARYLNLFETPRLNNLLLCKYYAQMAAAGGGAGAGGSGGPDGGRRQGSFSRGGQGSGLLGGGGGGGGGGNRPGSREWRAGGG